MTTAAPHPASQASVDRWQADLLQSANIRARIYRDATLAAVSLLEHDHPARLILQQAQLDAAMVRP